MILKTVLTKLGLCLLGILLSFVLLSVFVSINLTFTEASEFAREGYLERVKPDSNENPLERLNRTVWRFDWIFIPTIVVIVSIVVAALDRSRIRSFLSLAALTPLFLSNLFASSFSLTSLILSCLYILLSFAVSVLVPGRGHAS